VFHRTAYELRSCRLYTGCRWVGSQITPPAPPARTYRPRFRQRLLFSMLHQRFIYIHLLSSHLPANADFSAVAHDRGLLSSSRTAWFDACLCRPTSRDLPSSTSVAPKRRSFSPSFTSHLGCPISNPSPFLALILNQGRFPPPTLLGFLGTTSPSVTPSGPACPSRASGWASRLPTRWAFPCCAVFLFHACHRHYPGGTSGCSLRSLPQRWQPSPLLSWVGFRVNLFEACSAFTHVTACMVAKSLSGPSTPKASAASLLVRLLRLLPAGAKDAGWGLHPRKDRAFARRTKQLILK